MFLDKVVIHHFRNIDQADIQLSPQLTLIVGKNGQGKTNLLEAIHLLAQGYSFRTQDIKDFTNKEAFPVSLTAFVRQGDRQTLSEYRIVGTGQPKIRRGPNLPVVIFSPDDLELVKGAPAVRRRFLDLLIGSTDRRYVSALRTYQRALLQRNHSLKESSYKDLADHFIDPLVDAGFYIWQKRQSLIATLMPRAKQIHQRISHGETINSQLIFGGHGPNPVVDKEDYRELFVKRRADELARRITLVGPHRDDLQLYLDGRRTVNGLASQGQQRTVTLSLRLATHEWLYAETGIVPLVLLDDVLSELDTVRRTEILRLMAYEPQQTIVTDTEPRNFDTVAPIVYQVQGGRFQRWMT